MWKIEITWKQLYEDIYVKFTKNESDQKTFIKEIFPDGLYQKMFVRSGKVQSKYWHSCSSTALEQGPQQACSSRRGRVPPSSLSTASICCAKFN